MLTNREVELYETFIKMISYYIEFAIKSEEINKLTLVK